jgi:uncharacterized protein with FMN-binding domain
VSNSGSNHKIGNSLLALSSAAVLAVYAAGYVRTKSAADRFALQAEERRPAAPATPVAALVPAPTIAVPVQAPGAAKTSATAAVTSPPRAATAPAAAKAQDKERLRPVAVSKAPQTAQAISVAPPSAAAASTIVVPALPAPPVEAPAAAPEPPAAPVAPPKPIYKDGTYLGWGTSRHGDIQAQVVIQDGRIKAATIAQCLTRYSCNVISNLPPQVAQRQSPETDYVSGATQSTNAFYYAVVEALSKAK